MRKAELGPPREAARELVQAPPCGYPPREYLHSGWDLERPDLQTGGQWLAPPHEADERRRPWFRPRRGWLRRLERNVAHGLSRHLFPRLPLIDRPYSRQLGRSLEISESRIELPGLPAAFDGCRLLLITDVHAGPFVTPSALAAAMGRLTSIGADAILIGGDLTTSRLEEFVSHREAFGVLRAPLGVWAVLGNHDHYTGQPRRLSRLVREVGIGVLHNRSVRLERDGAQLSLAGVDDTLFGRPDLDAALRATQGPVVLLSHNPDLFFEAARRGVALTLSGHTHAGQLRLPGRGVIVRQSRYRLDEGHYVHRGRHLIVSRGLGVVGLPLRVCCRPEAVLVHLRRSPA